MTDDRERERRAGYETARLLRLAREAALDEDRARDEGRPKKLHEYGPLGNHISEEDLLRGYRGLKEPEAPKEEGTE